MGAVVAGVKGITKSGSGCGLKMTEQSTVYSRKAAERRSVTVYW
jgi:hypothetical protein